MNFLSKSFLHYVAETLLAPDYILETAYNPLLKWYHFTARWAHMKVHSNPAMFKLMEVWKLCRNEKRRMAVKTQLMDFSQRTKCRSVSCCNQKSGNAWSIWKKATGENRFNDKKSDIYSIPCLTDVQCCISHCPIKVPYSIAMYLVFALKYDLLRIIIFIMI